MTDLFKFEFSNRWTPIHRHRHRHRHRHTHRHTQMKWQVNLAFLFAWQRAMLDDHRAVAMHTWLLVLVVLGDWDISLIYHLGSNSTQIIVLKETKLTPNKRLKKNAKTDVLPEGNNLWQLKTSQLEHYFHNAAGLTVPARFMIWLV